MPGASGARVCAPARPGSPDALTCEQQYSGNVPSNHENARPFASRAVSPARGSGTAFAVASLAALLASTAPRSVAQETANPPVEPAGEDVVVMSAFTVDAGDDSG